MRTICTLLLLTTTPACLATASALSESEHAEHDDDDDHDPLPEVAPERVARVHVLNKEDAGQPTEVISIIDVHAKSGQQDHALQELRTRAAALDADAIIGVEFHHGEHGGETTHLSGTAVRYRDLIAGRHYAVIGDLDVRAAMGQERQALHDLRARARDMNADLIIGVHFEHGEGGDGGLRLTGKAIQFR
jgi:uncharacterized protein YbjQ (UPF0145 family)